MKTCARCKETLPISSFGAKDKNRLQPYCRECNRIQKRIWYAANAEQQIAAVKRRRQHRLVECRDLIYHHLLNNPCVDCGETDIRVLEFDHVRDVKTNNISVLIRKAPSLQTLQREISKCEVRCTNCHRRRTIIQFGWWQSFLEPSSTG